MILLERLSRKDICTARKSRHATLPFRATPPGVSKNPDGRSPGSQVAAPLRLPGPKVGPVACRVSLAAHSCGGSHGFGPYRVRLTVFRSEEHTSELPSLMRISYAVLCLKKKPR